MLLPQLSDNCPFSVLYCTAVVDHHCSNIFLHHCFPISSLQWLCNLAWLGRSRRTIRSQRHRWLAMVCFFLSPAINLPAELGWASCEINYPFSGILCNRCMDFVADFSGAAIPKVIVKRTGSRSLAFIADGHFFSGGQVRYDSRHAGLLASSAIVEGKRARGAPRYTDTNYIQLPPRRRRSGNQAVISRLYFKLVKRLLILSCQCRFLFYCNDRSQLRTN